MFAVPLALAEGEHALDARRRHGHVHARDGGGIPRVRLRMIGHHDDGVDHHGEVGGQGAQPSCVLERVVGQLLPLLRLLVIEEGADIAGAVSLGDLVAREGQRHRHRAIELAAGRAELIGRVGRRGHVDHLAVQGRHLRARHAPDGELVGLSEPDGPGGDVKTHVLPEPQLLVCRGVEHAARRGVGGAKQLREHQLVEVRVAAVPEPEPVSP